MVLVTLTSFRSHVMYIRPSNITPDHDDMCVHIKDCSIGGDSVVSACSPGHCVYMQVSPS